MDYSIVNTLTIQLESDEISSFFTLLTKLKKQSKRIGFKKEFTSEERFLIEDMYLKLLGDEEDSNKDK